MVKLARFNSPKNKTIARRGFTLIELLVVVSIIGLLSSVVLVSVGQARVKSRDAKRMGDVSQIQKALELYYDKVGSYPTVTAGSQGTANNWNDMLTQLRAQGLIAESQRQNFSDNLRGLTLIPTAQAVIVIYSFPAPLGVQDPLYSNRWYGYVPDGTAAPQNYRIRVWLENTSLTSLKNSLSGPYIYDDVAAGLNACDPSLGYYCTGTPGAFDSGFSHTTSSIQSGH